ncbi:hypothetical protein BDZ94DRAFT_1177279 [Collybia nuda]|uniref:Uncharacterized protein n=1 Tax=Collybia nuda TaxID=64659 RepID=A0A9P6C8V2_9AGAR|nr:hypothetical protein BDZ94DRAFT_1177279 [Collybia nuda]
MPPEANFQIVKARFVAFFVENIILGFYFVTFYHTMVSLLSTGYRRKAFQEVNYSMFSVSVVMCINVTMGSALDFLLVWRAFVQPPPGGAAVSFKELSYWGTVLKSVFLLFQTTIGDAMLIYRCWIVYARSWLVVAFSILMWIGGSICAIFIVYYESTIKQHALVSAGVLHPFGVAFWATTVALNVITTSLLVWPLWKVARNRDEFAYQTTGGPRPNTIKQVMQVIVESGLLYTVVAFMTFVTYTIGSNSLYVASGAEVGIAGIAFNLIIIRTAKVSRTVSAIARESTLPRRIVARDIGNSNFDDKGRVQILVSHDTIHDALSKDTSSSHQTEQSKTRMDDPYQTADDSQVL